MLAIVHSLSGAAIGSLIGNLPLVIILAILSHYCLDFLPHLDQGYWENQPKKKYFWAVIDFLIVGIVLYLLF